MFYLCYWCRKCAIFRTLKPIVFNCDMGAMNWQIRHTLMFVYIFFHVDSVGVGADLSCPIPRISPKLCCVFPLLVSQFIVPHPRNSTKWRCNSHHFDILKPIGLDWKTGTMNRPLRLAVCSLPYICAINNPHVDVRLYIFPRSFRRRRGRFIVPVPT